jgi:Putative auto-transporter adhesin, head GIN domain
MVLGLRTPPSTSYLRAAPKEAHEHSPKSAPEPLGVVLSHQRREFALVHNSGLRTTIQTGMHARMVQSESTMAANSYESHRSERPLAWLALLIAPVCGCEVIHGSGHLTSEERDVSKFDRMVISGEAEVEFVQEDDRPLSVEAEDNIIEKVVTKVENGALVVETKSGAILEPTLPITVRVSGPVLGRISMQGSGKFSCETLATNRLGVDVGGSGTVHVVALESDDLEVNVSGSGELSIDDLSGEELSIDIPGSGRVGIAGDAHSQTSHVGGSGTYFGSQLESDDVAVDIDGSGDVEVFAQRTLNVSIDGSGNVRFKGDASVFSLLGGTGSVAPL